MRVLLTLVLFISSVLIPTSLCVSFSYNQQNLWTGVCNAGNTGRQSPINIVLADVVQSPSLTPLVFNSEWDSTNTVGTFSNTGHNIQYDLNSTSPDITTVTPIGTYKFLQFHMHWGNQTGVGSEHLINGEQSEVEIHFVHQKVGASTAGNMFGVVGVFADVGDIPMTGIWQQLNASNVPAVDDVILSDGIRFTDLLPSNRDYYYYEGGLTTPPCTEAVQFFLLKNRITVPSAYLARLRSIDQNDGPGAINYRDIQSLNGRVVMGSGSNMVYASCISVLLFAVLSLQLVFFV
uniref:carbonic anhydrase n=1 Tax=Suberites domuncula TaxID=55567 RepID=A0A2I2JKT9_SUBDO|nr:CA_SubDo [Suberites domuncula]